MKNESVFSESFKAGKRTYFFDIKETSANKRYLSITESKKVEDKFERFKMLVFEEDIALFAKYFNLSLLNFFKQEESLEVLSHKDRLKAKFENAYEPWTEENDNELELLYCKGNNNQYLSKHFKRNIGAIKSRIVKLELPDKYPDIRE